MVTSEERMSRLEGAYEQVDRRLDAVDRRLDGIDQRLDGIDRRLDAIDRRFDAVDRRFGEIQAAMDRRFNSLMVLIGGGVDYGHGGHHRPHCDQLRRRRYRP